ncbi:hypothetical protein Vretimale_179 [Volvox reticuliferus]|uniref:Uncharacterized protein n=1 Tax=Volvox reticuliferus TaxID=1737510 RepID=A0A8J4D1I6_9CHLO|nr:hypothetical protein Vretimale_179 [Volvox reticuliferus]
MRNQLYPHSSLSPPYNQPSPVAPSRPRHPVAQSPRHNLLPPVSPSRRFHPCCAVATIQPQSPPSNPRHPQSPAFTPAAPSQPSNPSRPQSLQVTPIRLQPAPVAPVTLSARVAPSSPVATSCPSTGAIKSVHCRGAEVIFKFI